MASKDNEIWKPVTHLKGKTSKKYAVSNTARLASFDKDIKEKYILKQHLNGGFPMVTIHTQDKTAALFVHHAVAHNFVKKNSPKHKHVLHLDYNKANNAPANLKWGTRAEQIEHSKKSPFVLASAARKVYTGATSKKLNEKKVTQLKNEIWNPKRKLTFKQLAAKYNIAEMNLYRIKNGELWFHVHVEGEPIFPKYKAQLKNIEFHAKADAKASKISAAKKAASAKKASRVAVAKKVVKKAIKKVTAKKAAPKKVIVKKAIVKKATRKSVIKKKKK